MNYEIREMKPTDADLVLEIFKEGLETGDASFETEVPTWEAWEAKHLNICRWVLEDHEEKVIGWAALLPFNDRDCYKGVAEVSIYLSKNYQAKGLGQMLLQKLILDSEDHEFWTLQASVFPENIPSVIAHEKMGFKKVGIREKIAKRDHAWRNILLLERRSIVVGIS